MNDFGNKMTDEEIKDIWHNTPTQGDPSGMKFAIAFARVVLSAPHQGTEHPVGSADNAKAYMLAYNKGWDDHREHVTENAHLAATPSRPAEVSESSECYPLQANIWKRRDEWVLELSGNINGCEFISRHTEPVTTEPEDVAGLPTLHALAAAPAPEPEVILNVHCTCGAEWEHVGNQDWVMVAAARQGAPKQHFCDKARAVLATPSDGAQAAGQEAAMDFVKEFVVAWDEGMAGDTALYRTAQRLLALAAGQEDK